LEWQKWLVWKLHAISASARAAGSNTQTQIATASNIIKENLKAFENGVMHLPLSPSVAVSGVLRTFILVEGQ